MKSGSEPDAIIVFSFSFSLPAGTMKLRFTPVFFVMYCEVASTPHLLGNQEKLRYQSNVIGDVSAFQPGLVRGYGLAFRRWRSRLFCRFASPAACSWRYPDASVPRRSRCRCRRKPSA